MPDSPQPTPPLPQPETEHFCTLFDRNYLPLGMTLHASLLAHAQPFHLWILCMDEQVEQQLSQLALPHVSLIPLSEIETPELLAVKPGRTRGEYCWTLTPFSFQVVFDRCPAAQQVTYLDADLFFFADPKILLRELSADRHVLITDHAYAPEYDQSLISGQFCVQFLTFKRTESAFRVMHWWQARCLEWCFNRVEDGKFGDQKYLDAWTTLFPDEIQIVQQVNKTLAPWNVHFFQQQSTETIKPVFYHFHGLKLVKSNQVQLFSNYQIGTEGMELYHCYLTALKASLQRIQAIGATVPAFPLSKQPIDQLIRWKRLLTKETQFVTLG